MVDEREIVIELDSRRLIVLGLVLAVGFVSFYTYVVALFAFISPSQDLPLDITGVATYDTGDISKTSFSRGSTLRIKADVEKAWGYYYPYYYSSDYYYFYGGTGYRVIFAVMDNQGRPFFFDSSSGSLSAGGSQTTSFDYKIPSGASVGIYTIRVMAWSDWLPPGVVLAPDVEEITFEVT
jgi:hypothetical protein